MTPCNEKELLGNRSAMSLPMQIFVMSQGTLVSIALAVAAELGIADLLADGPLSSEELARATATHPTALYRILRLLGSVGVFTESAPRQFSLTALGEHLRSGIPGSMRSWVRLMNLRAWLHTYAEALHCVRTGEPAFKLSNGAEFFDYFAAHPSESAIFNGAMDDVGRVISAAVVEAYDFNGIGSIVDVGGGHGTQISAILLRHPQMRGVLFDLPYVVVSAREAIDTAGLSDRCEFVGGDFFQSLPAGCDAYLLRWIIHDWEHDRALTILGNCRQAMKETGRLLLVEAVIPPGDESHPGKFTDILMLTGLGGEERTESEYGDLLSEAGFRLKRVVPTTTHMSVIEAVPV
jgi:hypothetical protein